MSNVDFPDIMGGGVCIFCLNSWKFQIGRRRRHRRGIPPQITSGEINNRDAPDKEAADALVPSFGINWPSGVMGKCKLHLPMRYADKSETPRTPRRRNAKSRNSAQLFSSRINFTRGMGGAAKSSRAPPTRYGTEHRELDSVDISLRCKRLGGPGALAPLSIEFTSAGAKNQPFLNKLSPVRQAATLLFRPQNSIKLDSIDRVFGESEKLIAMSKRDQAHARCGSGGGRRNRACRLEIIYLPQFGAISKIKDH